MERAHFINLIRKTGQIFSTRLKYAKLEVPMWDVMQFEKLRTLQAYQLDLLLLLLGLVTLDEMKAKREDLVREHEKQLAAKLKSEEPEG